MLGYQPPMINFRSVAMSTAMPGPVTQRKRQMALKRSHPAEGSRHDWIRLVSAQSHASGAKTATPIKSAGVSPRARITAARKKSTNASSERSNACSVRVRCGGLVRDGVRLIDGRETAKWCDDKQDKVVSQRTKF